MRVLMGMLAAASLTACVPSGGGGGGSGDGGLTVVGGSGGAGAGGAGAEGGTGGAGAEGGAGGVGGAGGAGGAGGGAGGAGGGAGGAGGGTPPLDCDTAFGAAGTQWRLPFPLVDPVGANGPDHFVADLNADGFIDLVVNGDGILPGDDPLVSRAYWLVYFGGASGFASEGVQWRIPYSITDQNGQPNTGDRSLIDLNGDGLTDWVVTKDDNLPESDPLVGRAYWLVYANNGAGFDEGASQWRLPFPMGDDSALGSASHNVVDLDGDGAIDLMVHHDDILSSEDPLIGRAYWMVYPNTGAGFGEGAQWRLPFSLVDGQDRSQLGSDAHSFFDLTGDGLGDMVVYDERLVDDPLLSRAYWLVYANNGDGFDQAATQWRLPFSVRNGDRGTISGPEYQLINWDGDESLDLLVYANGLLDADDPLIGRAYWLMFPNAGDGFSGDAVQWRLPFSLADEDGRPFSQHHTVWALDSQCPGLVFFDDELQPDNDPLISRAYWSVHP